MLDLQKIKYKRFKTNSGDWCGWFKEHASIQILSKIPYVVSNRGHNSRNTISFYSKVRSLLW
jgi:hypothetical protein